MAADDLTRDQLLSFAGNPATPPLTKNIARNALAALADRDATIERLTKERDDARQIVRDIYWMALRYADGRYSYAVGMVNDAVEKAYAGGWLEHKHQVDPAFARDGHSPEWQSIEARATTAERERDELKFLYANALRNSKFSSDAMDRKLSEVERERDEARAEVERLKSPNEQSGNPGLLESRIAAALYADGSDLCDVPWEFVPDHMKIGYFGAAKRVLAALTAKGGENAEG